jgi:hypothetical protein
MDTNSGHSPDEPQNQKGREGNYRNIETSVNDPSYFNDDYALRAENEIATEESKPEKEQRTDKRGNHWKGPDNR